MKTFGNNEPLPQSFSSRCAKQANLYCFFSLLAIAHDLSQRRSICIAQPTELNAFLGNPTLTLEILHEQGMSQQRLMIVLLKRREQFAMHRFRFQRGKRNRQHRAQLACTRQLRRWENDDVGGEAMERLSPGADIKRLHEIDHIAISAAAEAMRALTTDIDNEARRLIELMKGAVANQPFSRLIGMQFHAASAHNLFNAHTCLDLFHREVLHSTLLLRSDDDSKLQAPVLYRGPAVARGERIPRHGDGHARRQSRAGPSWRAGALPRWPQSVPAAAYRSSRGALPPPRGVGATGLHARRA